ncbi:MAG: histidinol-phosphate transaminase [Pseudomonadales bacterium]|nr:histidinol-phosphate transaminase [Pseudomonadales bacterium]
MTTDFIKLGLPGIQGLRPYQAGKPIDELKREMGITKVIKLASNENPIGPGSKSLDAIKQVLAELALYPDGSGFALKQKLVEKFALKADEITLGNGSSEIFTLLLRCYVSDQNEVVYSQHGFALYSILTRSVGATPVVIPAINRGHDLDAMVAAINDKTALVFIANPNNPTGTYLSKAAIKGFMEKVPEHVIVVLDEAYAEYVEQEDYANGLELVGQYKNLVVTRTFSKAYGLAALRIGYGVSNTQVADMMNRVREPFNVNSLALVAAEAALDDDAHLEKSRRCNREGIQQLVEGFNKMGLEYIPTVGNFISVNVGRDATDVYQDLLKHGMIVRPIGGDYELPKFLRVTIGLPEQNKAFLDALAKVLS